jgi:hypothetical protein
MEEVSTVTLFSAGGICLLAAVTAAQVDSFGLKFHLQIVWRRWAVAALGLLFIGAAVWFQEKATKTPDCYVSGTATTGGDNSPASVSGCRAEPGGGSKQ